MHQLNHHNRFRKNKIKASHSIPFKSALPIYLKILMFALIFACGLTAYPPKVNAQSSHVCGADHSEPAMADWNWNKLKTSDSAQLTLETDASKSRYENDASTLYYIPVTFHIEKSTQDEKESLIEEEQARSLIDRVNFDFDRVYKHHNFDLDAHPKRNPFLFKIKEFKHLDDKDLPSSHDSEKGPSVTRLYLKLFKKHNVDNTLNIYLLNNIKGAIGFSSSPWHLNKSGIVLQNGEFTSVQETLMHEIGHYFGLYHTFGHPFPINGIGGKEAKTRDPRDKEYNCTKAGDGLCDTAADFKPKKNKFMYRIKSTLDHISPSLAQAINQKPEQKELPRVAYYSYSAERDQCYLKYNNEFFPFYPEGPMSTMFPFSNYMSYHYLQAASLNDGENGKSEALYQCRAIFSKSQLVVMETVLTHRTNMDRKVQNAINLVYPNPVSRPTASVTIDLVFNLTHRNISNNLGLSLVDMQGKAILNQSIQSQMHLDNIAEEINQAGTYETDVKLTLNQNTSLLPGMYSAVLTCHETGQVVGHSKLIVNPY